MGKLFKTMAWGSLETAETIEEVIAKSLQEAQQERIRKDSRWLYKSVLDNPRILYVSVVKDKPEDALRVVHRYTFDAYLVKRKGKGRLSDIKVLMLYLVPR